MNLMKNILFMKRKLKLHIEAAPKVEPYGACKIVGTYSYTRFPLFLWFVTKMQLNYTEHQPLGKMYNYNTLSSFRSQKQCP